MQTKTTVKYQYIPLQWIKWGRIKVPSVTEDAEQVKLSYIAGGKFLKLFGIIF